jgi:hypothetical protein
VCSSDLLQAAVVLASAALVGIPLLLLVVS